MAARAKKKITTTTEEVDADDADAVETEKDKLDDETIRALTELDGASDIKWNVYRLGGSNPGFCPPAMTTPELTLENIARKHGAGHYRVKGFRSDGTYCKSATITIAESAAPAVPDFSALLKDLSKPGDGMATMMPMLMQMMQSNTQIVTAALSRQPEKTDIPWSAIIAATPLTLGAIKEFFAKKDGESESMEKILKLITVVEKLRGSDDKGSTWTDIVRDALPALQGLVARSPVAQSAAVHAVSTPSASLPNHSTHTNGATLVETPEAVAPTVEMQAMEFFKRKFDELLRNAAENKDPELRAELLLDDLPGYVPDSVLKEMLSHEDWFTRLCAFDERVANYHGWFAELRDCVLRGLNDDATSLLDDEKKEGAV